MWCVGDSDESAPPSFDFDAPFAESSPVSDDDDELSADPLYVPRRSVAALNKACSSIEGIRTSLDVVYDSLSDVFDAAQSAQYSTRHVRLSERTQHQLDLVFTAKTLGPVLKLCSFGNAMDIIQLLGMT